MKTNQTNAAEDYEALKRKQERRRLHWQKCAAASRKSKAEAKAEYARANLTR